MKRSELKKILKPLIKECIKECFFEEGVLSGIIAEVAKGLNVSSHELIKEDAPKKKKQNSVLQEKKMKEQKRKLLDAIGRNAYNNVDLFENTRPQKISDSSSNGVPNSLAKYAPEDAGVDISGIMNLAGHNWKNLI